MWWRERFHGAHSCSFDLGLFIWIPPSTVRIEGSAGDSHPHYRKCLITTYHGQMVLLRIALLHCSARRFIEENQLSGAEYREISVLKESDPSSCPQASDSRLFGATGFLLEIIRYEGNRR